MQLNRREFLNVMAAGSACGMFGSWASAAQAAAKGERLYDIPRAGNVSFLHFTDCHAQLLTKINRQQLGMTVSEVQKTHIACSRNVVEPLALGGSLCRARPRAKHAAGRTCRHDIEKLTPI